MPIEKFVEVSFFFALFPSAAWLAFAPFLLIASIIGWSNNSENQKQEKGYLKNEVVQCVFGPIALFGLSSMFQAVGIAILQFVFYSESGVWTPFTVAHLFKFTPEWFVKWVEHPTEWIGLQKIVVLLGNSMPLSAFVLCYGLFLRIILFSIFPKLKQ